MTELVILRAIAAASIVFFFIMTRNHEAQLDQVYRKGFAEGADRTFKKIIKEDNRFYNEMMQEVNKLEEALKNLESIDAKGNGEKGNAKTGDEAKQAHDIE